MTPIMKCTASLLFIALAACGSDTVIHERPVVVQTAPSSSSMSPESVERVCEHGYDNSRHACY